MNFGAASAEEFVALDSFTTILQGVFAQIFDIDVSQMFDTDVSLITIGSVETTTASATLIAFSATRSGMSRPVFTIMRRLRLMWTRKYSRLRECLPTDYGATAEPSHTSNETNTLCPRKVE